MAVANRRSIGSPKRRRWWWLLVPLVLLIGGYTWYRLRAREPGVQETYTTLAVVPAAYDLTLSGPGTLEPARSVSVGSSVEGTIETIPAVGDTVASGEVLVQLETTVLQQAVDAAQLALEQARSQEASLRSSQSNTVASLASDIAAAERTVAENERALQASADDLALAKRLRAVGSESGTNVTAAQNAYDSAAAALAGSKDALATLQASASVQDEGNAQDLRNAELAVQSAQLTLTSAQRDLEAATIRAPMGGVVTSISDEASSDSSTAATIIQAGTTLGQGETILTLSDYSTIDLIAQIDETQISEVGVGQKATVTVDALDDQTFDGTVTAVAPSAQVEDNIPIFEVTVEIANPDLTLRPGMTAEASIAVETLAETLTVPTTAVQSTGYDTFIQVESVDTFVPLPVNVVGNSGLNSVVTVAEMPALPQSSEDDAARSSSPNAASQAPMRSDVSERLEQGEAVTVRVPTTAATTPGTSGSGDGGPGGGFGGPPGGDF